MKIRLTGISTPIGGASWEYLDGEEQTSNFIGRFGSRIKVFISSKCGEDKYDNIRGEIKDDLEQVGLFDVYCFEKNEASTLTAYEDYSSHLLDSDVCIFLIDNADGVPDGVSKEFDMVQKNNIKALYYFCDESKKEETSIEKIIKDSDIAKSSTIHKFEDLSYHGARGIIDDIIFIYHRYCRGWIGEIDNEDINNGNSVDFLSEETLKDPQFPKSLLKNLNKCRQFLLELVGFQIIESSIGESVNEIDEWGRKFLGVLFEKETIKSFNSSLFLEEIEKQQHDNYHEVVCKRWDAIQRYFLGDVASCIKIMEEALQLAEDTDQPSWFIQDILIDIRNQQLNLDTINNCYTESEAQKALNESKEAVYYPLLDRFYQSLQEKYIEGIFKETTKSPNSVTIGSSYNEYGDLFASSLIVSMYNGSLTHILMIYDKLFDFLFYLSYVNDTWIFKRELLKFAIYLGDKNKINGILRTFPEILNNINDDDARIIMEFSDNNPIDYQRFKDQIFAFGTVGYYLNDDDYEKYETLILNNIEKWIDDDNKIVNIGDQIFDCLHNVCIRVNQDKLAHICILFMEKHLRRWYDDLFKFITNSIDINKMGEDCRNSFLSQIINILSSAEDKRLIEREDKTFLYVLRNQDLIHTNLLDEKIKETLPDFYNGPYKLETTEHPQKDFPKFIQQYIDNINENNISQGVNGHYVLHSFNNIRTIRAILLDENFSCSIEQMDSIIEAVSDTLLFSNENINTKLDAISLLICIVLKFPEDYERNKQIFNTVINQINEISNIKNMLYDSNVDKISINIGLCFLQIAMGSDAYGELLQGLAHIHDNVATIRSVAILILEYLEVDENIIFSDAIDALILDNVLQWLNYRDKNIRYYSTEILLYLLRRPCNKEIINQEIIKLIDSNSSLIKELILEQIKYTPNISEDTIDYIISHCKNDTNYVVRIMSVETCK